MKILKNVHPTSEQLSIISNPQAGVSLIRGAAGSGKTTTAVLMLRLLARFWDNRARRQHGAVATTRILVLTFNRTLQGYVSELAASQLASITGCSLEIMTFGKWANHTFPNVDIVDNASREYHINHFGSTIPLVGSFLVNEVDYLMGRFAPGSIEEYIDCRRIGRGALPRVDKGLRRRILDEIVVPYTQWLQHNNETDWNGLAVKMAIDVPSKGYDIIVVDEAQDFSANQIRAIMHHAAPLSSVVFVLDAAQRIYPRGCTWREAGVSIEAQRSHHLKMNHRNTTQICEFAMPLLAGLDLGDDGSIPDLESCQSTGPLPLIIKGRYSAQLNWVMNYIRTATASLNPAEDSVAFLHPKGWFNELRQKLGSCGIRFVEMTQCSQWPAGNVNVGLVTMHSAKGLEFDHVIIIGLSADSTHHGDGEGDDELETLRRLLAMSILRARKSVVIGYKENEASDLISYLTPTTFEEITL